MSKKKHRKLKKRIKRNNRQQPVRNVKDRHHIMWIGAQWSGYWAKQLRLYPWFIVLIPRDTLHRLIHHEMSGIPVPRESSCREAYVTVMDLEKRGALSPEASVETRIELLIALFDCVEPATATALKKELDIVKKFYAKPS